MPAKINTAVHYTSKFTSEDSMCKMGYILPK